MCESLLLGRFLAGVGIDSVLNNLLGTLGDRFGAVAYAFAKVLTAFGYAALLYILGRLLAALANVLPGAPMFDVSVIPHAQDAIRHLFPNITVTTHDGKKVRTDTRASLALPF